MKESEAILKRHKYNIRFKNPDMDFAFTWILGISQIIGMSASQVFYAVRNIKDGDPAGWRNGFTKQANSQLTEAVKYEKKNQRILSGQAYMGSAYCYRASLQYTDPTLKSFKESIKKMEKTFIKGVELLNIPIRPVEIPFEDTTLSGYYLEHDDSNRPTLIMIGGGDTFREDLFYFAGYPGWKREYNVLMVDLPGQGKMPYRKQTFRLNMNEPISTVIDWLEENALKKPRNIAIYGVSGGGYFTAEGVTNDERINAWIASTPITDIAELFSKEFGNALKAPSWLIKIGMKIISSVNESANINLKKYAWQFGTNDFKTAVKEIYKQTSPINTDKINCPSLFLLGESEAGELKRQTYDLYRLLKKRGIDVTLREFSASEGADAHCQLNNLRLVHTIIFDWLDRIFDYKQTEEKLDIRILS